jgi:hypothetical protein
MSQSVAQNSLFLLIFIVVFTQNPRNLQNFGLLADAFCNTMLAFELAPEGSFLRMVAALCWIKGCIENINPSLTNIKIEVLEH